MTARKAPPSRKLAAHPDLDQLKRQAKELLAAFRAGDPAAVAEVRARYRDAARRSTSRAIAGMTRSSRSFARRSRSGGNAATRRRFPRRTTVH